MTLYGYGRVPPDHETLDPEFEALKEAGCTTIVRETIGGAKADRAQLAGLLETIGGGDVLIVSRLDRLARSTRDLLDILDTLAQRGATFRSLSEPWADTTTPDGRSMLTVLGGLSEFDRTLITARTSEGRARAAARGQHMGRPAALTPHQRRQAITALRDGTATQADLARRFDVAQSTISRLSAKMGPAKMDPALQAAPPPKPMLDADTAKAARAFLDRLEGEYVPLDAFVFGSRARGDHGPDSDADIAVILKGPPGNRYKAVRDMGDAAYDAMVETGIHVSVLPLWESELQRPALFSNPVLIETIKREGRRL